MQLPPELDFLAPFLVEPTEAYKYATWLLNDFDADVWEYSFEYKTPKELDWRVKLDDHSLLTEPKNKNLLLGFKYFLIANTRDSTGYQGETNDLGGQQLVRFTKACYILDYLLINGRRYQLAKYGLEGLTAGNLQEMLKTIAGHPSALETIYNWRESLRDFCVALALKVESDVITEILAAVPQLSVITEEQIADDELDIPNALIPQVRAALYYFDLYHIQASGRQPNTIKISQDIYKNTLWGLSSPKTLYGILSYNIDSATFIREYRRAPVTSSTSKTMQEGAYFSYRRAVYTLGVLHELWLPAPTVEALIKADQFSPQLASAGRFRTLPSEVVFKGLRQAIEFHLDYGKELTKAFCRVALECRKRGVSPTALTHADVQKLAGPKLYAFGVRKLGLSVKSASDGIHQNCIKGEKSEYFDSLRSNNGLYELIAIYIGCAQLTVGILTARRASELYGLNALECLDETELWLLFKNAKSTRHLFGLRRREARPIEPIAVDMIKTLIRMQKVLTRIGYIDKPQTLFAAPSLLGSATLIDSTADSYNRKLDLFCDYFETPLNANGERYYFRQHQMRRFFAMLFFYCGSFAKLDTLQWMLGHTDPTHVYRYITESTDGAILASAKAQVAAEELHQGNYENFKDLMQLLKEHYGTEKFTLISADDLEDQIMELMKEGWIEIEPEFFSDHQGKKFKIVARLKRSSEAA